MQQTTNNQANGQFDKRQNAQSFSEPKMSATTSANIAKDAASTKADSQRQIQGQINSYFESGTAYLSENPKEAAALAVAAGMAAWALLYTKPGRKIFDMGAEVIKPKLSNWIADNFSDRVNQ